MYKEIESKWRAFQVRWQTIVGRAKNRGATKEELDQLKLILPLFKKYNLYASVVEEDGRKEVEG